MVQGELVNYKIGWVKWASFRVVLGVIKWRRMFYYGCILFEYDVDV